MTRNCNHFADFRLSLRAKRPINRLSPNSLLNQLGCAISLVANALLYEAFAMLPVTLTMSFEIRWNLKPQPVSGKKMAARL